MRASRWFILGSLLVGIAAVASHAENEAQPAPPAPAAKESTRPAAQTEPDHGDRPRAVGGEYVVPAPAGDFGGKPHPSKESLRGLDWFIFFLADVQTGFGPFIAVYLTTAKWTQAQIGLVLSIGSVDRQ